VVRANRNQTAGSFLLALDGKTDCTNPPCFCKITAKPGLNLRTGPGTQYSLVRPALWPGFIVEPLACTVDQQWYYVSATELGVTGWIRADPDYVECEPCISCNILSPGIDVSVIPEPAGPVTRGSTVVFHVSVRNTGKTPLDRLSLNNAFTGTDSAYLPTGEACSELNDQSLAVGAEKTCDIAISNVAGGFVSANATASAIGPYDATVADSGSATVEIVAEPCATPEIELRAEPGVYTIQDECGSADFNLSVVNKSAEPITITLVTLDGLALRQNTLEGQQCFESQTLTGGQILGGCSLRVPLDGGVCNEDDKIMAWEVSVTAETDRCEATAKTPLRVIFYRTPTPGETPTPRETPTPTPTHCLKCGPYLEQ
jgi:hypothetical protein